ncbi:MAG TPA: hypothetical protein VFK91_03590, partial [Methyloceanibacter sp.]|nr:hypothetical protein [Methyloceanibacter sp.]
MNSRGSIGYGIFAAALLASSMALAQAPGEPADHSAHHPGQQAEQPTPQTPPNRQMMGGCPMMEGMMGQGKQGMMSSGMMGSGMMGSGMMGSAKAQGGMGALFGSRVTPIMSI